MEGNCILYLVIIKKYNVETGRIKEDIHGSREN